MTQEEKELSFMFKYFIFKKNTTDEEILKHIKIYAIIAYWILYPIWAHNLTV